MTELAIRNSQKFLSARSAGEVVGYTSDYVTRLAREEKIVSKKEGRQWMIDIESLKLFTLEVAAEKRRRKEELREQRRIELVVGNSQKFNTEAEAMSGTKKKIAFFKATAVAITLMVLGSNFSTFVFSKPTSGNTDQIASAPEVHVGSQEASVLTAFLDWWNYIFIIEREEVTSVSITETKVETDLNKEKTDSATSEYHAPSIPHVEAKTGNIVIDNNQQSDNLGAVVADAFSDEVLVEFQTENSGVIIPQFREKQGDSYPFVLIDKEPDVIEVKN